MLGLQFRTKAPLLFAGVKNSLDCANEFPREVACPGVREMVALHSVLLKKNGEDLAASYMDIEDVVEQRPELLFGR